MEMHFLHVVCNCLVVGGTRMWKHVSTTSSMEFLSYYSSRYTLPISQSTKQAGRQAVNEPPYRELRLGMTQLAIEAVKTI